MSDTATIAAGIAVGVVGWIFMMVLTGTVFWSDEWNGNDSPPMPHVWAGTILWPLAWVCFAANRSGRMIREALNSQNESEPTKGGKL
jgi:hypothetical protein